MLEQVAPKVDSQCPIHKQETCYTKALQGEHPDIRNPHKWKKDPNESPNRAINLFLRDIFTPLSLTFYERIVQTPPCKIAELVNKVSVYPGVYTDTIFKEEFAPFIDNGAPLCPHAVKQLDVNGIGQEFCANYASLPDKGKAYFRSLLTHTKTVATLSRYNLNSLVTGKYRNYLWSPVCGFVPILTATHSVDTTVVPIGHYGYESARKMVCTTNVVVALVNELIFSMGMNIECENWDLLSKETARGQEKVKAKTSLSDAVDREMHFILSQEANRVSTLDTFKEALQSIQAAFSSLCAEKVMDDEVINVLQLLVDNRLPIQIAKLVPFGYTLPVVRRGRYFPQMLRRLSLDKWKLSDYFLECAEHFREDYLKNRVYATTERNPGLLGFGCPAAIKKKGYQRTSIGYILDAYIHIYKIVDEL